MLRLGDELPSVLRAILVWRWDLAAPRLPWGEREAVRAEMLALRADHNFCPPSLLEDVLTGIRATVALLQQIDKSLEEASQGMGANSATTFRRVTLPLIMPAFFAGLGVVFIRSMTAISATISS